MLPKNDRFLHRQFHRFKLCLPQCTKAQRGWWLGVIVYLLVGLWLVFGSLLRLQHVDCLTNLPPACPDYIQPELAKYSNQLIYRLNRSQLASQLKQNLPLAESVSFNLSWPNHLTAFITWQAPLANLVIPASTNAVIVGQNGYIIETLPQPNPDLPIIIASAAADLGVADRLTEPSLVTALGLAQFLPVLTKTKLATIDIRSPLELRVIDQNHQGYLFSAVKDLDSQLHALQLISSQTTMISPTQVVDLRFDRPAIKPTW